VRIHAIFGIMDSSTSSSTPASAASVRGLLSACCAVVSLVVLSSCATPIGKTVPVSTSEEARSSLGRASSLVVYEGLPHQTKEAALLQTELARPDTTRLVGYPFYKPPVAAKNKARLRSILADPATYGPYTGPKTCGGFHPDYAVSWTSGGTSSHLLICYGCSEALISHQGALLPYDIRHNRLAELKGILAAHAEKRP
jgi:hypothetical protein